MPTGIQLSSGVVVGSPKSLDAKYGPYDSVNDALNDLSSGLRHQGLTVGIKVSGSVVEYWFKDGVANEDFVEKQSVADWNTLANKPSTFTPSAHGSSHHTNGTDAIAPNNIGAAWEEVTTITTVGASSDDIILSAARNQRRIIQVNGSVNLTVTLPVAFNVDKDIATITVLTNSSPVTITVRRFVGNPFPLFGPFYETLATLQNNGDSVSFISNGTDTGWSRRFVELHTHPDATQIVAGFLSTSDKLKLDGIAAGAEVNVNADWDATTGDAQILNKPSTFTPSAHASSHHTGGSDQLAAHQINGQTIFVTGNAVYSSDQNLGASRALQFTVGNTNASGINLTLPTAADGTLNGDTIVIIGGNTMAGPITVRRINVISPLIYETLATISTTGEQYRFRAGGSATGSWSLVPVDTHTHTLSDITDAGTAAASDTGDFAAASHVHPASEISDSTAAGRALLTAGTVQNQRVALDIFVPALNASSLPASGNLQRVYLTLDNGKTYIWSTTSNSYIEISPNIKPNWNATSGDDAEILNKPTLGTAASANTTDFAPANLVGSPVEYVIACSNETTALTAGIAKVTFRAPIAFQLTSVSASVTVAPTGSTLVVDINNGANSALSTKLSIDASEKTSATAATAAVIDTTYDDFSADAEITIDIDQIGSTVAGAGLKVILKGTRA